MEQLFKLKDGILGFLTPQAKRRCSMAFNASPTTTDHKSGARPYTADLSEPRDHKAKSVLTGRVSKKYLSPGDTSKRNLKRARQARSVKVQSNSDDDDSEVDAESRDDGKHQESTKATEPLADYGSSTNVSISDEAELDTEEEEIEDEDAERLAAEQKVEAFFSYQDAMEKNKVMFQEIREEKWHTDEIRLFEKLAMRGLEPLMSTSWYHDFRTCPQILFTEKEDETFINSISGNEFRATHALESLTTLGSRIRALVQVKRSPELLMKKEIDNYVRWSEKDAGYSTKRFIPLLATIAGNSKKDKNLSHATQTVIDRMNDLALQHRSALALPLPHRANELGEMERYMRPPPVVFGVVSLGTVAVILSLDAASTDGREPKTITTFNFDDNLMDVWNGIAIAILVITVRNSVLEQLGDLQNTEDIAEQIKDDGKKKDVDA